VDNSGNTCTVTPSSGTTGEGDWSDLSGYSASNTVAIAVNEIPEFQDIALPFLGLIAVFIVVRRVRVLNTR
jgi:hypothetical protein